MLYLVGLGLNEKGLALEAIDALKKCDDVYCEFFTSLPFSLDIVKKETGKEISVLERGKVESDFLVEEAKTRDIALLVPGDPLSATTHFELYMAAKKRRIPAEVIHAASIFTAVAESGLSLYKFGRTTSLVTHAAESPYDIIRENMKAGLHSMVLLDTDMTVSHGLILLMKNGILAENSNVVVCVSLGTERKRIIYDNVGHMLDQKLGTPAVIIVLGRLNFKEEESLELWL